MTTYLVQLFTRQRPPSLPLPIGKYVYEISILVWVALLAYLPIRVGLWSFAVCFAVVGLFLYQHKAAIILYLMPSLKPATRDAFRFGYSVKYGRKSDEFVKKFSAQRRLDESSYPSTTNLWG